MAVYKAPIKDIQFVLNEVLDVSSLAKLPGYEEALRALFAGDNANFAARMAGMRKEEALWGRFIITWSAWPS